jgi:putative transposase
MSPSWSSTPGRRSPARGVHIQSDGPTLVFLTVKARGREPWIASTKAQQLLQTIWTHRATAWSVGDYLLMPDHLHLFCAPQDPRFEIERWIAFWKDRLAKNWAEAGRWQSGGFHHRLRSRIEYEEKWAYVMENPLRAGLADHIEEWPYRGRVHSIGWF